MIFDESLRCSLGKYDIYINLDDIASVLARLSVLLWRNINNIKMTIEMKNKTLLSTSLALMMAMPMQAQKFEDNFENKTLRLDYIVAGDSVNQAIYFEQAYSNPTWAGRKTRLDEKFLNGNGQVTVYEHGTNKVLYVNTFSTLFQEWQLTQEAKHLQKSFESSFLVPFPKKPVDVSITLSDTHQKVTAELRHTINPQDILFRPLGENGASLTATS